MLQSIITRMMAIFQKRYDKATATHSMLSPMIRVIVDKTMQDGRYCTITYVGRDEFQVKDGFNNFVVKLTEKTCCNFWQISSLPANIFVLV